MRKYTLTGAFLAISLVAFAQKIFTETLFRDAAKRWQSQPATYDKTEMSPDFMFVGTSGEMLTHDEFIKFTSGGTTILSEFSKVKIRQFDKTAIVTGIWKHAHHITAANIDVAYNELFTFTFQQQKDKWMLLSIMTGQTSLDKPTEEAAIKKLLDDVDAAFNGGDSKTVIDAWRKEPNLSFVASDVRGAYIPYAQDYETLKKRLEERVTKPTGIKGIKSNHRFTFKGNIAIVEFDQVNQKVADNTTLPGDAHNFNILEKVGDSWKVLVASHHSYMKPDPNKVKSIIYHKVEDYTKWKAGFDAGKELRAKYNELSFESGTLKDDPKTVYVIQEWKILESLQGILADPQLKEAMGKAGVISAPTILIFDVKDKGN